MTRIDPNEARRWLPTQVAQLYEANRIAARLLAGKAAAAPTSAEAGAYRQLEQSCKTFDAWTHLAGLDDPHAAGGDPRIARQYDPAATPALFG